MLTLGVAWVLITVSNAGHLLVNYKSLGSSNSYFEVTVTVI